MQLIKKCNLLLIAIIVGHVLCVGNAQDQGYNLADFYDQEEESEYIPPPSPCNVQRRGDPDLTTYDILSSYRFDEHRYDYQGVQLVTGSTNYQTAYHFSEYSNVTIASSRAFPKGVPDEFSFECTFRVPQRQPLHEWFLFELTNYHYESLMSVTMNPIYYTIEFSLPKYDGSLQTVSFKKSEIFDRAWHKVMLGVTQNEVRLWVDCEPVPATNGYYYIPLDVRGPIDATEGAFTVARECKTKETVPIDLQWMIFSCDVDKPEHTGCEEIPPEYLQAPKGAVRPEPNRPVPVKPDTTPEPFDLSFLTTSTEPSFWLSTTPAALEGTEVHACPVQCPRGPPGPPGAQGSPGLMGAPGSSSSLSIQELNRLKGAKGEPGLIGLQGLHGEQGEPGLQGPPGLHGAPGLPGFKGERGTDGLPGAPGTPGVDGANGAPGLVGAMGPPGQPGLPGPPGTPGAVGAQGVSGVVTQELRTIEEREIREICMAVVRDYISEISSTLVGPPGPPGKRGVSRPGAPGPPGIQGATGPQGLPGDRGYPGMQGLPGPQGERGPRGPEGQKGDTGVEGIGREGAPGVQGPPGVDGRPGIDGSPGRPGERGDDGRPGEPGVRGPRGDTGVCPDCGTYQAAYAYPLLLAQQQQNNKGPQNYYNKG